MLQGCVRQRAQTFAIISAAAFAFSVLFLALVLVFSPFKEPPSPNSWIGAVSIFPVIALPVVSLGYLIASMWTYARARE
jgi:hypothetical protein